MALLTLLIKQLKKRNVCFILVIANGGCRQAVKTKDCGSFMRGFESHHPPHKKADNFSYRLFYFAEIWEMRTHHKAKLCKWERMLRRYLVSECELRNDGCRI